MEYNPMKSPSRSEDQIQDDKSVLVSIKNDFLRVIEDIAKACPNTQSMIDSLIASEEHLNDALSSEWDDLCEEAGYHDDLPQSKFMKQWIQEQKKPTRRVFNTGLSCQTIEE